MQAALEVGLAACALRTFAASSEMASPPPGAAIAPPPGVEACADGLYCLLLDCPKWHPPKPARPPRQPAPDGEPNETKRRPRGKKAATAAGDNAGADAAPVAPEEAKAPVPASKPLSATAAVWTPPAHKPAGTAPPKGATAAQPSSTPAAPALDLCPQGRACQNIQCRLAHTGPLPPGWCPKGLLCRSVKCDKQHHFMHPPADLAE